MGKQDITEIIVKQPTGSHTFSVVNNVREGIYKTLIEEPHILYKIERKGDGQMELDLCPGIYTTSVGYKEDDVEGFADIKWDSSTEFSEKWVKIDGIVQKKEVIGDGSTVYGRDFQRLHLVDMEGIIVLSNGKFLINRYGKYQPNLSFINSVPEVKFEDEDKQNFNLPKGSFSVVYGDFFISKKGTKCFRILPKEKAKHILICDDWGGAFNKYRGRTLPEEGSLYYRRASSNGGGTGYDYGVYPIDWKYALSEEDI